MRSLRIEKVGDINFDYPYLELFFEIETSPFMEIGINEQKHLSFKIYNIKDETIHTLEQWDYISSIAKEFLSKSLRDEDDFLNLK